MLAPRNRHTRSTQPREVLDATHNTDRARIRLFVALCALIVAATLAYTWVKRGTNTAVRDVTLPPVTRSPITDLPALLSLQPPGAAHAMAEVARDPVTGDHSRPSPHDGPPPQGPPRNVDAGDSGREGHSPIFLVRHTGLDQSYGVLAVEYGTSGSVKREATALSCLTVHFAANRGVCLYMPNAAIPRYAALLFDANFQTTATLSLSGIPSRTRVSPDGRYAAITVFISGHSYAASEFSTETQIIDSASGKPIVANLEQMEVWSNRSRLSSLDFNFWGVTFSDDRNRFYASLGTGGSVYLVEGNIAENRVTVLREGVECPSLSPDNTRVAFKKRVSGSGLPAWRLHVLDLASLKDVPLVESRSVDEQVGWLDNSHVTYTKSDDTGPSPAVTNVWVVPADGGGKPAILLRESASATVIRSAGSLGPSD
jgi:hypothetical protein